MAATMLAKMGIGRPARAGRRRAMDPDISVLVFWANTPSFVSAAELRIFSSACERRV
jgi:hypothetical protein